MGGEVVTPAPSGIAGTGITAFVQIKAHSLSTRGAPAPPPETWDAYSKKSGESTGVMTMIDLLIKDLDKEMQEAETGEKDSQSDYTDMMADSADKRASDSKSLTQKESAKADLESALSSHEAGRKSTRAEIAATEEYISSLHGECDWLLQYHDMRKQARADE